MYAKWIEQDSRFAFSNIDNGGIELSEDEHIALRDGEAAGKIISSDVNGAPCLIDPPPAPNPRIAEINAELTALDFRKIRPIATGDTKFLATLNAQSDALRNELKGLTV